MGFFWIALIPALIAVEIDLQVEPGVTGRDGELNCKYNLGDSTLLELTFNKGPNDKKDESWVPLIYGNSSMHKSTESVWKNPEAYANRLDFELNKDLDGWTIATLRLKNIVLSDKNDYTCKIRTRGKSVMGYPEDLFSTNSLDVYFPPTKVEFSPEFNEKTMTGKCFTDNSYPSSTFEGPGTAAETIIEDNSIVTTFEVQLTEANDNEEFTCSVSHPGLDVPLSASFSVSGPTLPDSGELNEELIIGGFNLLNSSKVIFDFESEPATGVLTLLQTAFEKTNETCTVTFQASVGEISPPVNFIWFVDETEVSQGAGHTIESKNNGTESVLTVIGKSAVGVVALQYNFQEVCFPPEPETTVSLLKQIEPTVSAESENPVPYEVLEDYTESQNPEGSGFDNGTEDSGDMSGAIIGSIAAGSIAGVLLIAAVIYFLCFGKKDKTVYRPNDKGSGSINQIDDFTASIDMTDVVEPKKGGVQRSVSGTWNKPVEETTNLLQVNNNSNKSPSRSISTQTLSKKSVTELEEEPDMQVTLKNTSDVYGSTRSVHV